MLKKLSSTLLKFWWASSKDKKPIYWRKKEVLFAHKEDGGMGIKNVVTLNKALLARQCWRLHDNPNLLVSRVFKGKYGADPIVLGFSNSVASKCSWGARSMIKASMTLRGGLKMKVGNGKSTRALQDI